MHEIYCLEELTLLVCIWCVISVKESCPAITQEFKATIYGFSMTDITG